MKAIQKDFWREIRYTRSRFLSILILVALAVAFLSGLRCTAPDMKNTCDSYLDQQNFMDIQVLSTLGLTEEDLEVLLDQPGVSGGEIGWTVDAYAQTPDLDIVAKVHSLPQELNTITLTDGRMPRAADECVAEEHLLELLNLEIGDQLTLSTSGDYADALAVYTVTVVGVVISPLYISVERGTSTLGTGQVAAYLYLPRSAFAMDYYTALYLTVEGAAETTAFSEEYDDLVDGVVDALEPLGEERAKLRRESLVDEATEKLDDVQAELDDAKAEAEQELADAETELADARAELDDGWAEYYDGLDTFRREIADAEQELSDGEQELTDALTELADGEAEYADGYQEYLDGKAEAEEKIADAENELADARRKIADIGSSEWYILSRDSNPGYLGFGQDADRMGNLASVFPVLFFLVAALVCLTTMTRMVDDQRVQIGCLKALGYTRWTISRKYLGYGLLPALIGGALGLAIGFTLFPSMIFTAYQIMYDVPDIELTFYPGISAAAVGAAAACTTVSTLAACLASLADTPASLMRPRAPKAGKRVLLEYIRPLWRRMSFNHKVTARNLLRYQKRFWMTVIGIGGCTSLIIAGFGIRASLLSTMSRQYEEIYHYTAQVAVADNLLDTEREAIEGYLSGSGDVVDALPCYLTSVTAETDTYSTTAYLEAADPGRIGDFVTLRTMDGEPLTVPEDGAVIDQKLSELLDVGPGDSITVDGDTRAEVTVAAVTEHYLGHFIYLSPAYYEEVFGEDYRETAYLLTLTGSDQALCDAVFADLMSLQGVQSATRMETTRDTYLSSMERIDFVVVIVILSAAALAMVVLYNLSNINITERKRELATIRVLGFYDREVSAYVNRENVVLTAVGIVLGCVLGHFLHVWLVKSVEIDLMMFGRDTDPTAYVWAALLTALFSAAVSLLAHRKMKGIDMVESLKSAE